MGGGTGRLSVEVAAHDLLIENARGTEDRWRFRLRGPDRTNLAAFQQALLEDDVPLYIHRVWNPTATDGDPYGLTEAQRETLEHAFTEGHFEVPRNALLDDLGETYGVTPQLVSRRVREGVYNLLAATLMNEATPLDD